MGIAKVAKEGKTAGLLPGQSYSPEEFQTLLNPGQTFTQEQYKKLLKNQFIKSHGNMDTMKLSMHKPEEMISQIGSLSNEIAEKAIIPPFNS